MARNVLLILVFGALVHQELSAANGNAFMPSPSKMLTSVRYGLEAGACCCDVCVVSCKLNFLCAHCISQQSGMCELSAAGLFGLFSCVECIACLSGSAPCVNACIPCTCCGLCFMDYLRRDEERWVLMCVDPVESCAKSSTQWCQASAKKLRVLVQPQMQSMGGD